MSTPGAGIVYVSTGLRQGSVTDAVGDRAATRLRARGHRVVEVRVRDLPSGPLLWRHVDHPGIAPALAAVADADAVVVSSAVLQASFSGLLKVFLDLLPKAGLGGKTVLPLLTGGSHAHVLALDYSLRPVLQALGAAHVASGRYVVAVAATAQAAAGPFSAAAADEVDAATDEFAHHLEARAGVLRSAPG
ncbi:NAD(P)H-dependent oxidoreductase [Tessaracoccus sp. G1721]